MPWLYLQIHHHNHCYMLLVHEQHPLLCLTLTPHATLQLLAIPFSHTNQCWCCITPRTNTLQCLEPSQHWPQCWFRSHRCWLSCWSFPCRLILWQREAQSQSDWITQLWYISTYVLPHYVCRGCGNHSETHDLIDPYSEMTAHRRCLQNVFWYITLTLTVTNYLTPSYKLFSGPTWLYIYITPRTIGLRIKIQS